MNTHESTTGSIAPSPAFDAAFSIGRKVLAIALAYLMVPLGVSDLYAQTAPPPPPDQGQYQQEAPPPPDQGQYQDQNGQYNQDQYGDDDQGPPPQTYYALSPEQLNRLVAPIALYPDALVAQVLAASTYPDEIAAADNFVRENQGAPPDEIADMVNQTNWDPSVKSLVAFPSVLENMDRNMDWTQQLGNAYYNQPQDVMNAIQDMRARAYAAGNLRSGPRLVVDYNPGYIVIAPANPSVYYVPWYNPWVVYGAPVPAWGGYYPPPRPVGYYVAVGVAIGFGIGIAVASWNHYGWGCHHWGMGWRDRTVVYQQNIYISRSVRVVNHGYYGHFDRDRRARQHNFEIARRAPNFHPVGNRRPDTFNPQTRHFVPKRPQPNRNFGRPQNNVRQAQQNRGQFNRNQNLNRPQQNRNFNQPQNNVRQAQQNRGQFNRNQNFNRPQQNKNFNRPQENRNFNRPQENRNFNRPQPQNRQQYNRPQQNPNFNRPQQNRNFNRPQPQNRPQENRNFNRPQPRPQQYNRPEPRPQQYNRPQPRPQANRPQPRPQANRPQPRPQQNRPENRGHGKDHGHFR